MCNVRRLQGFPILCVLVGSAVGCTSQRLVPVRDACGRCRLVAAPIVPRACGPIVPLRPAVEPSDASHPDGTGALLRKLETTRFQGLRWQEIDLPAALSHLTTRTGVGFQVSERARHEKVEDIVITLQVDGVSARAVLDLITEPYALRWEVQDAGVSVHTLDEVDGPRNLRTHDMKDLLGTATAGRWSAADGLADELRVQVHPRYWESEGSAMEGRNGVLIVRASAAVHDAIATSLALERTP